jgi:ABC-type dipeptide/oligopeptide/nickel transport system permease subunit
MDQATVAELEPAEALPAVRPRWWMNLRRHRSAQIGGFILLVFLLGATVGAVLVRNSPTADFSYQDLAAAFEHPSLAHPLGTDWIGRDVLVRLIYGARYTMSISTAAVLAGLVIGIPIGAASGYFGGWFDLLVQRVVDIVLAFPSFLLALALLAAMGTGFFNVILAVSITSFPRVVRLLRASTLSLREMQYVEAARVMDVPDHKIVARHIVPNALAPLIVRSTMELGGTIVHVAGLGFLGLGINEPTPEWGTMLGEAHRYIFSDPVLLVFPAACIVLVSISFNLLGDALRDVLDPRLNVLRS